LNLWKSVLMKNEITVSEYSKVDSIIKADGIFKVGTKRGYLYTTANVLLAIGRRGSPRKLNIPGELSEKVAYRLLEPEDISGKDIIVVGGGDSAVESALMLSGNNNVILSYRNEVFNRIKPDNTILLNNAIANGKLDVRLNTNLVSIEDDTVTMTTGTEGEKVMLPNDLVYIFAGGELPIQFLEKSGILITKKFGEIVMKH